MAGGFYGGGRFAHFRRARRRERHQYDSRNFLAPYVGSAPRGIDAVLLEGNRAPGTTFRESNQRQRRQSNQWKEFFISRLQRDSHRLRRSAHRQQREKA